MGRQDSEGSHRDCWRCRGRRRRSTLKVPALSASSVKAFTDHHRSSGGGRGPPVCEATTEKTGTRAGAPRGTRRRSACYAWRSIRRSSVRATLTSTHAVNGDMTSPRLRMTGWATVVTNALRAEDGTGARVCGPVRRCAWSPNRRRRRPHGPGWGEHRVPNTLSTTTVAPPRGPAPGRPRRCRRAASPDNSARLEDGRGRHRQRFHSRRRDRSRADEHRPRPSAATPGHRSRSRSRTAPGSPRSGPLRRTTRRVRQKTCHRHPQGRSPLRQAQPVLEHRHGRVRGSGWRTARSPR